MDRGCGDSGNQSMSDMEKISDNKEKLHIVEVSPVQQEKPESGDRVGELKLGSRIADDIINSFCDKLQKVCPRRLDGLFAIQYVAFCEEKEFKMHISGKNDVLQVLYEHARNHYSLVFFKSSENILYIYDSLQQYNCYYDATIPEEVELKILKMLGHVNHGKLYAGIDQEYDAQKDNYSCGYRVIGAIIDLARGQNPAGMIYNLSEILAFVRWIIETPEPNWEDFENVKIGVKKEDYSGEYIRYFTLKDPQDTEEDIRDISFNTDNSARSYMSIPSRDSSFFDSLEPDLDSNCSKSAENIFEFSKRGIFSKNAQIMPTKSIRTASRMDLLPFNSFKKMFSGFWKTRSDLSKKIV